MPTTKVGIREFRENLADYLESKSSVAITRHGATIGIFVPTKPNPSQADRVALRIAGERTQELIAAAGTTEDELVIDFKKIRRERRAPKKLIMLAIDANIFVRAVLGSRVPCLLRKYAAQVQFLAADTAFEEALRPFPASLATSGRRT